MFYMGDLEKREAGNMKFRLTSLHFSICADGRHGRRRQNAYNRRQNNNNKASAYTGLCNDPRQTKEKHDTPYVK